METLEESRKALDKYDKNGSNESMEMAVGWLEKSETVFDIEHVNWLIKVCARRDRQLLGFKLVALRLLNKWCKVLPAAIKDDGVGLVDPIRDELVDSAVTFLEDEQVQDRTVEEKIDFLVEKGLNRTEIRIACAQVGIDAPSSLLYTDPIRKDLVENGAAFLVMDHVKSKPLIERLQFLKGKGLRPVEITRACEIAKVRNIPTAEEIEKLPAYVPRQAREDMIKNGAIFLQHKSMEGKSLDEKLAFLKKKGMTGEEILKACDRANVLLPVNTHAALQAEMKTVDTQVPVQQPETPVHEVEEKTIDASVRDDMVKKGVTFLTHPSVQEKSLSEKLSFLRGKGLVEAEISAACKKANVTYQASNNVQKGVTFLKHPSTQNRPFREKVDFLRNKGLNENEIKEACEKAGIKPNAVVGMNLASSIDVGELQKSKERVDQARSFLLNKNTSDKTSKQKVAFLLKKGLSIEEIELAFFKVGVPWEEEFSQVEPEKDLTGVEKGVRFLKQASTLERTTQEKAEYLLERGLTLQEIVDAFSQAGIQFDPKVDTPDPVSVSSRKIQQGKVFLEQDATLLRPVAERKAFLRTKGLTEDEIHQAFVAAGVSEEENSLQERVEKAKRFLTATGSTQLPSEIASFLTTKGFSKEEIRLAFQAAGMTEHYNNEPHVPALVKQGRSFLLNKGSSGYSGSEKVSFLKSKGLSDDEIAQAFELARMEIPSGPSIGTKVTQGKQFLENPKTQGFTNQERQTFLRKQGLTQKEIEESFKLANVELRSNVRDDYVERGVAFLTNPEMQNTPVEDRVEYLQKQGLTGEEVLEAAIRAKIDLVPSHLCTIPMRVLKVDRLVESDELDPTGRALQRGMNCVVDILIDMEDGINEEEFAATALTFLSTSLCRCRPANIAPSCVAFTSRVFSRAFDKSALSVSNKLDDTNIQAFLDGVAELIARASQVNIYTRKGLKQMQQVKLYFLSATSLLVSLMAMWKNRDSIAFEHGILLARAIHGEFSRAASTQPFKSASGPAVDCVNEHLVGSSTSDAAAYIAAGLLRGAPDYAWGSDVKKSPQPLLERALQEAARVSVLRNEKAQRTWSVENDLVEMRRASGVVVAVGLSCVYADTQITWNSAVYMAVIEGLFRGAIWNKDVLKPGGTTSDLEERAQKAKRFVESEEFKLAPQLVSLLLSKLSKMLNNQGKTDTLLFQWLISRIHGYSSTVFKICEATPALSQVLARRTVQLVYGTGKEEEAKEEEEEAKEDMKRAEENPVEKEETKDPLEQYLGIHSGIARILQMGYLSVVILGGRAITKVSDSSTALVLWDSLANLGAFQVRVQDTVDLEELLKVLLKLEVSSRDEMSYLLLSLLGEDKHVAGEGHNWVLGARVEHILSTGEEWLLPTFLESTQLPSSVGHDDSSFPFPFEAPLISADNVIAPTKKSVERDENISSSCESSAFGVALCKVLVHIGVQHAFVHLNMRAHRWMTDIIRNVEAATDQDMLSFPPIRLACIPNYVETSISSHPDATSTQVLSFVLGSVLTSLGEDPDERAQTIALMSVHRLMLAVDDRMAERPPNKTDGKTLATLMLTCLKAVSHPLLPPLLNSVRDVISRAPAATSDVESKPGAEVAAEPFSREWFKEDLFQVIGRTEDTPRRVALAKWYLETLECLSVGGKL